MTDTYGPAKDADPRRYSLEKWQEAATNPMLSKTRRASAQQYLDISRDERLGTMSDWDLAEIWGCCRQRVTLVRNVLGLPAFTAGSPKEARTEELIDAHNNGLIDISYGKDNFRAVMKMFGWTKHTSRHCVTAARRQLGFGYVSTRKKGPKAGINGLLMKWGRSEELARHIEELERA